MEKNYKNIFVETTTITELNIYLFVVPSNAFLDVRHLKTCCLSLEYQRCVKY